MADKINWPEWNNPEQLALRMIRAMFDGPIPHYITVKECLELMVEFSKFESGRAQAVESSFMEHMNRCVSPTIWLTAKK